MNAPRKHHYVQQAHLALFADESGRLQVLSKDGASFRPRPKNVFAERDLYSFEGQSGLETQAETEISKLERKLFPYLREIAETGHLTPERADAARAYVACSILRNPTHQQMVFEVLRSKVESAAAILEREGKINRMDGTGTRLDGKMLTQMLADGDVNISIHNSEYLRSFAELMETKLNLMQGFDLSLLHSETGAVAIGDHPVTFCHPGLDLGPYGVPFGGNGCELTFPVSKHIVLIGRWQSKLPDITSEEAAQQANIRQAMFTRRLFASAIEIEQASVWLSRYRPICFRAQIDRLPGETGVYTVVRRALFPSSDWQQVKGDIKPLETYV